MQGERKINADGDIREYQFGQVNFILRDSFLDETKEGPTARPLRSRCIDSCGPAIGREFRPRSCAYPSAQLPRVSSPGPPASKTLWLEHSHPPSVSLHSLLRDSDTSLRTPTPPRPSKLPEYVRPGVPSPHSFEGIISLLPDFPRSLAFPDHCTPPLPCFSFPPVRSSSLPHQVSRMSTSPNYPASWKRRGGIANPPPFTRVRF